jgi:hypothetical protein
MRRGVFDASECFVKIHISSWLFCATHTLPPRRFWMAGLRSVVR